MKQQLNVRLSESAHKKLHRLMKRYGTQTAILEVAIDKLYSQEQKMDEKNIWCTTCEQWIDEIELSNYHQSHHTEKPHSDVLPEHWLKDADDPDLLK